MVAASTTARSTSTASRSRARSSSPSWSRTGRRVWARERRADASTSAPAGVMVISGGAGVLRIGVAAGPAVLLQAPHLTGHGGLAGVVGVGEVPDARRAELVDLGEQPDLRRGCLQAGLPRRPAGSAGRPGRAARRREVGERSCPRYYIDNLCTSKQGPGRRTARDVVSCGGDQRPRAATVLLNLRLHVPPSLEAHVQDLLESDPRVAGLAVLPGASRVPAGDVILVDVPREAAGELLDALEDLGLGDVGSVTVSEVQGAPFRGAQRAEHAAPGSPDDGVLWRLVQEQAEADSRGSLSFYTFMTVAVALAAIAVITDSSVLVVGAMVVGPEFAAIAAAATGIVLGQLDITRRAIWLLARSFTGAVLAVTVLALLARPAGWVTPRDGHPPPAADRVHLAPRPLVVRGGAAGRGRRGHLAHRREGLGPGRGLHLGHDGAGAGQPGAGPGGLVAGGAPGLIAAAGAQPRGAGARRGGHAQRAAAGLPAPERPPPRLRSTSTTPTTSATAVSAAAIRSP